MEERLQKIISRAGIASRRAGEEIILAGRVRVNGRVITELGAKADVDRDTVEVDGRRLVHETLRYLVLHKPRGVVSTLSDPEGRPTVASLLEGAGQRLYPVGRLDFATSGVLLVTNDGDFANGLLHPSGGVPKTYVVKVNGVMTEDDSDRWRNGVRLDDGPTLPAELQFLRHEDGKTWFEVTLREGRNQQIRRMGEATGFPVMRLARTSFAGVNSDGLRPGQWRSLTVEELYAIREKFGVPKKVRRPAPGSPLEGGTVKPRAARIAEHRPPPEGAAAIAKPRAPRSTDRRGPHEEAPTGGRSRAPRGSEGGRPDERTAGSPPRASRPHERRRLPERAIDAPHGGTATSARARASQGPKRRGPDEGATRNAAPRAARERGGSRQERPAPPRAAKERGGSRQERPAPPRAAKERAGSRQERPAPPRAAKERAGSRQERPGPPRAAKERAGSRQERPAPPPAGRRKAGPGGPTPSSGRPGPRRGR